MEAGYVDGVIEIIQRLASAPDAPSAVELLHEAKRAIGADQALFVSFVRGDDASESFRFLLACDPRWCLEYQQQGRFSQHPWLLYAARNSAPARASDIARPRNTQQGQDALEARFAVASACIVPAHPATGSSRLGVLGLTSPCPGYFDGAGFSIFKVVARALAMELHEWWIRQIREEFVRTARIVSEDLQLLRMQRQGLSTKEIARQMRTKPAAIDSRFQRLISRMQVPNRKAAARVAAEHGLI